MTSIIVLTQSGFLNEWNRLISNYIMRFLDIMLHVILTIEWHDPFLYITLFIVNVSIMKTFYDVIKIQMIYRTSSTQIYWFYLMINYILVLQNWFWRDEAEASCGRWGHYSAICYPSNAKLPILYSRDFHIYILSSSLLTSSQKMRPPPLG